MANIKGARTEVKEAVTVVSRVFGFILCFLMPFFDVVPQRITSLMIDHPRSDWIRSLGDPAGLPDGMSDGVSDGSNMKSNVAGEGH